MQPLRPLAVPASLHETLAQGAISMTAPRPIIDLLAEAMYQEWYGAGWDDQSERNQERWRSRAEVMQRICSEIGLSITLVGPKRS